MSNDFGGAGDGEAPQEEKILKAFESWDKDGNGSISREELAIVLRKLNPAMKSMDLDPLFDAVDANKNGVIEYEEFLMFLYEASASSQPLSSASVSLGDVRQIVSGKECSSGCGRPCVQGFRTCCRSCPFVKKKERKFGHDMKCEIEHNDGMAFPWYWNNYAKDAEDFHDTEEGAFVQKMGERLISESIPGAKVEKCVRVENSVLWRKYAKTRAEIRRLARKVELVTTCGKGHALSLDEKAAKDSDSTPRCIVCRRPGTAYSCKACDYNVCKACYDGSGFRVGNYVKCKEAFSTYSQGADAPAYDVQPGWTGTICSVDWEGDVNVKFVEETAGAARRFVNMKEHASKLEIISELEPPKTRMLLGFSATTTLDDASNEVWLFHGTCEAAAQGITESSFRIPEKPSTVAHGALFGYGAYLAEAAKKSHVYSVNDGVNGCYVMLLCRAALGRLKPVGMCDEHSERFIREDDQFDSLIGFTALKNSGYAREFLVYDAAQVYPEYIMYYKLPE